MPQTTPFSLNVLWMILSNLFERHYYNIIYNDEVVLSCYILFIHFYIPFFDLSYIHTLVFKETFWCFWTGAICNIRNLSINNSAKYCFQKHCVYTLLTIPFCVLNTCSWIYWCCPVKLLSWIVCYLPFLQLFQMWCGSFHMVHYLYSSFGSGHPMI